MKKQKFFGWQNIQWFMTEIGKIYSNDRSFFSKKRIESSAAFVIAQVGMVWFLCENVAKMSTSDIVLWAGVEFAIAGYIVNQIQREKKNEAGSEN